MQSVGATTKPVTLTIEDEGGITHTQPIAAIAGVSTAAGVIADVAIQLGHPFTDQQRSAVQGAVLIVIFLYGFLKAHGMVFSPATVAKIQKQATKVGVSLATGVAAHDIADVQTFLRGRYATPSPAAGSVSPATALEPAAPVLIDGAADDPTAGVSEEVPGAVAP